MSSAAWEKYYNLTITSSGNWGDGMRLSKLPQNRKWENEKIVRSYFIQKTA